MDDQSLRWLLITSYVLWQSAIMVLVMCHYLAVTTLWRAVTNRVRTGLVAVAACLGLMMTVAGRASWQLRQEPEAGLLPHSPGTVIELLCWSAAAFVLAIVLVRELRQQFQDLQQMICRLEREGGWIGSR